MSKPLQLNYFRWWVTVGLLAGGTYLVYTLYFTKKAMAKKIVRLGKHNNINSIANFEKGFLESWADAAKKGESIFVYNNKVYNTQGGTVKK